MAQQMGIDARVQIAEGVQVFDEDFARSLLTFADAFARGDDGVLRDSMDSSGREIMDMLAADWSQETESIEAVRLVAAAAPAQGDGGGDFSEQIAQEITADAIRDMMLQVIDSESGSLDFEGVPPEMMEQVTAQMAPLRENPEQARQAINQMYESGMFATIAEQARTAAEEMAGSLNMDFAAAGEPDVSIAIQQPGAAFLVNFMVVPSGGSYIYVPTAGNDAVLTRASEWDDMELGVNIQAALLEEEISGELPPAPDQSPGNSPGGNAPSVPAGPAGG